MALTPETQRGQTTSPRADGVVVVEGVWREESGRGLGIAAVPHAPITQGCNGAVCEPSLYQHSKHTRASWAICELSGASQQRTELTGSLPRTQTVCWVPVATPASPGERGQTERQRGEGRASQLGPGDRPGRPPALFESSHCFRAANPSQAAGRGHQPADLGSRVSCPSVPIRGPSANLLSPSQPDALLKQTSFKGGSMPAEGFLSFFFFQK